MSTKPIAPTTMVIDGVTFVRADANSPAQPENGLFPAVILDYHRGVYFGYISETYNNENDAIITNFRHIRYFGGTTEGYAELATKGISPRGQVGATVKKALLRDSSKVLYCTPEAARSLSSATWSK